MLEVGLRGVTDQHELVQRRGAVRRGVVVPVEQLALGLVREEVPAAAPPRCSEGGARSALDTGSVRQKVAGTLVVLPIRVT